MATLDPGQAATIAHGAWVAGHPDAPLTSFAIDTRILESGQTFVALKTDRADGHAFLQDAAANGAIAAIVERPDHAVALPQMVVEDSRKALQSLARVWRQRFAGPVIGITGSYGKTTVKEMLGTVLGSQWARTRGNLNNTLGVALSLLELDSRHDAGGIIEAGISAPGEMGLLADLIDPDAAIITEIGPAHLQGLGDVDGVAAEKALLARAVRPGGDLVLPGRLLRFPAFRSIPDSIRVHAVCLGDDDSAAAAGAAGLEHVTIYHYNWTENHHSQGMGGLRVAAPMPGGTFYFRAGSPGMVSNLALVVHMARLLQVPSRTVQACLDSWRPFRHRGETYRRGKASYYVDCYNANPGSLIDSVRRFKNLFADQAHLYVIGSMDEMGSESESWHERAGKSLDLPAKSRVCLLGHGAEAMRRGLLDAGFAARNIAVVEEPAKLRRRLAVFNGAVFLKASRSCQLETLIPGGAQRC